MGWRFRRSIRIAPGLRINLGKTGVSFSFGGRGFTTTVGRHGTRTTLGIPGTGVSYTNYVPHANGSGDEAVEALRALWDVPVEFDWKGKVEQVAYGTLLVLIQAREVPEDVLYRFVGEDEFGPIQRGILRTFYRVCGARDSTLIGNLTMTLIAAAACALSIVTVKRIATAPQRAALIERERGEAERVAAEQRSAGQRQMAAERARIAELKAAADRQSAMRAEIERKYGNPIKR